MEDLFKKFLDNHCSPEEVKKLLAFFSQPENEILLRKLIKESIANNDANKSAGQETGSSDRILKEMKKQVTREKIDLISFFSKTRLQSVTIAVILFGENTIPMI